MKHSTCRGYTRDLEWCQSQQREALNHLGPHECDDPRCGSQRNVVQWIEDSFAEEVLLRAEFEALRRSQ